MLLTVAIYSSAGKPDGVPSNTLLEIFASSSTVFFVQSALVCNVWLARLKLSVNRTDRVAAPPPPPTFILSKPALCRKILIMQLLLLHLVRPIRRLLVYTM